jgi:hypothetical protein
MTVAVTVITSERPRIISKSFSLDDAGSLVKKAGGQLVEGRAQRREVSGPAAFAALLGVLQPNQALMYGHFAHADAKVLSKELAEKVRRLKPDAPIVARTKENTAWPEGPGIMPFDYDPRDGEASLSATDLREKTYEAVPALADAPHVCRPSASSCIVTTDGRKLRGERGRRIYIFVQDARDIERAAAVLQDRLWLAGEGYIVVSKSGALLERTLADAAMFQPSRLDFAGGAECGEGLVQSLPAPAVINPDAQYLDTRTALPDLTPSERKRLDEIKKAARAEKADEAKAARESWIEERVGLFAASLDEPDEQKHSARINGYEITQRRAIEDRKLFADFEITLDDGKTVTVGEILDNKQKYHGRECLDPIEPEYKGERLVGWLNLRAAGKPYLWSFAHGGARYELVRASKTIRLIEGEEANIVSQVMEVIRADGSLFERSGLVRIDGGSVSPVTVDWLLHFLDSTIRFERLRKTKEGDFVPVPSRAPDWLARRIIALGSDRGLPMLNAVIDAPTMDPRTGRVISEEGFDEQSGLYLTLKGRFTPIPEHVGESDAREAIKALWEPFKLFPFADPSGGRVSRGVFLSALLTSVARRLLPTAPGNLVSATAAGTGKTLLGLCLSSLMTANAPSVHGVAEGISEEEVAKTLLTMAMKASPTLLLDNVAGVFKSAALCGFLTSPIYESRILGGNTAATVPTNSLCVLTGNQPVIVGDLNRRLLRCSLDAGVEAPHKRAFKLNPVEYCREHRLDLVRAALVILKAWRNAGATRFTPDRTASFEAWSDTIRQCVIWIGRNGWLDVADPVDSIDDGVAMDPDVRKLGALLRAWRDEFGDRRMPVKSLHEYAARKEHDLFEALHEIGVIERGELNTRRFGRWIEQRAGRVVGGLRIVQDGSRSKIALWRIETSDDAQRAPDGGFANEEKWKPTTNPPQNPPMNNSIETDSCNEPGGFDGFHSQSYMGPEDTNITYIHKKANTGWAKQNPPTPTKPTTPPPWRRSGRDK